MTKEIFRYIGLLQGGPAKKIQELSQGEMAVLGYFVFEKDEATPTELSVRFSISTARIANTLNSLEKKGYIERIHDSVDRRKVIVHITQAGIDIFKTKENEAAEDFSKMLDYLGEKDSKEFLRLLKRVTDFMIEERKNK